MVGTPFDLTGVANFCVFSLRGCSIVSNGMDAPTQNGFAMCQSGDANQPLEQTGTCDMKVTTVGIDLAKKVFQLHGVNELGKTVIKKQLRRDQVTEFLINLPSCLIGMEASSSAKALEGVKTAEIGGKDAVISGNCTCICFI